MRGGKEGEGWEGRFGMESKLRGGREGVGCLRASMRAGWRAGCFWGGRFGGHTSVCVCVCVCVCACVCVREMVHGPPRASTALIFP